MSSRKSSVKSQKFYKLDAEDVKLLVEQTKHNFFRDKRTTPEFISELTKYLKSFKIQKGSLMGNWTVFVIDDKNADVNLYQYLTDRIAGYYKGYGLSTTHLFKTPRGKDFKEIDIGVSKKTKKKLSVKQKLYKLDRNDIKLLVEETKQNFASDKRTTPEFISELNRYLKSFKVPKGTLMGNWNVYVINDKNTDVNLYQYLSDRISGYYKGYGLSSKHLFKTPRGKDFIETDLGISI